MFRLDWRSAGGLVAAMSMPVIDTDAGQFDVLFDHTISRVTCYPAILPCVQIVVAR